MLRLHLVNRLLTLTLLLASVDLFAQEAATTAIEPEAIAVAESAIAVEPDVAAAPNIKPQVNSSRSAEVSLHTTVTGSQEQPQVLYILPWQSPQANAIDFELLDSQDTAVFGHVERDELRRELEANGEFD
jgi:hypothetical protein